MKHHWESIGPTSAKSWVLEIEGVGCTHKLNSFSPRKVIRGAEKITVLRHLSDTYYAMEQDHLVEAASCSSLSEAMEWAVKDYESGNWKDWCDIIFNERSANELISG